VARLKEAMLEHLVENFHAPGLQLKWTRPRQSLSQCAVPVGCDDGLPQGVQLIGARFREDLLLDAAQAIEIGRRALPPLSREWRGAPEGRLDLLLPSFSVIPRLKAGGIAPWPVEKCGRAPN
jgi:hypothetical protein